MGNQAVFDRIQDVFRDIFDEPSLKISRTTAAADIEAWDSLNHINLVVAIEKEFGMKFSLDDIQKLANVGEMADLVEQRMKK